MKQVFYGGIAGIISVVIVAVFLSFSFYKQALQTVEDRVFKEMLIVVKQTAKSIEDLMHNSITDLEWMSEYPFIKKIEEPRTTKYLNRLRKQHKFFYLIFRLERDGTCSYIYPPHYLSGVIGKNFAFREYFQQIKKTKRPAVSSLVVAGQYKDVKNKYKALIIAVPVLSEDGKFLGVLGTDVKITDIAKRFITPLRFGKNGYAWMLDSKGNTFIHPDPDQIGINVIKKNFSPSLTKLARTALATRQAGTGEYEYKGIKKLVSYAPVNINNRIWLVALSVPYGYVKELVYPVYIRLIFLMVFVVLVILLGGIYLIYKTKEVRSLKEKIVNLEIKIDEEMKQKEVGEITQTEYFQKLMQQAENFKIK